MHLNYGQHHRSPIDREQSQAQLLVVRLCCHSPQTKHGSVLYIQETYLLFLTCSVFGLSLLR